MRRARAFKNPPVDLNASFFTCLRKALSLCWPEREIRRGSLDLNSHRCSLGFCCPRRPQGSTTSSSSRSHAR